MIGGWDELLQAVMEVVAAIAWRRRWRSVARDGKEGAVSVRRAVM